MIEVTHLAKSFGAFKALDDVVFAVPKGKISGFLGPNGAGKTTTIKCLLGLLRSDGGTIILNGDVLPDLRELRFRIPVGVVLESQAFFPHLSAVENLSLLAQSDGIAVCPSRIQELLDLAGLDEARGRQVRTFSLGMKQKLALAAAFLNDPALLVLDEPFNSLDPNAMDRLQGTLKTYAAQGGTVFISSHLLAEVEDLCDGIVIIHRGKIIRQGGVREIASGRRLKDLYLELTRNGRA